MTILYYIDSGGKILQADISAAQPAWEEVTDPDVLATLRQKEPMSLEEFYPIAQSAQEAWEAD